MFIYSTRFIFTNYFFVFWIIFCRIERGSTAVRPDIPLLWWGNDGIKDLNFVRMRTKFWQIGKLHNN